MLIFDRQIALFKHHCQTWANREDLPPGGGGPQPACPRGAHPCLTPGPCRCGACGGLSNGDTQDKDGSWSPDPAAGGPCDDFISLRSRGSDSHTHVQMEECKGGAEPKMAGSRVDILKITGKL